MSLTKRAAAGLGRLTRLELEQVLTAIGFVTAGDSDGWTAREWNALARAEVKVREALHVQNSQEGR